MLLQSAKAFANRELERLSPYIVRGEIAGSIRRGEPIVKDIELVVIPSPDLFGAPRIQEGIYPASKVIKGGEKYKQIQVDPSIKFVVYCCLVLKARTDRLQARFSRWPPHTRGSRE
jgi:DNA polymerase/3'-5' exonuclease PolX